MPGLHVPDVQGLSLLDAAFAYAKAGWYLLPVDDRTARPRIADWDQNSSRDPEVLTSWFAGSQHTGIGLHVGRSGALVIDVDAPEALGPWADVLDKPSVPFQRSRKSVHLQGHYLFKQSKPWGDEQFGNETGTLPEGVDVRGQNGYIVVAPTLHRKLDEGGEYAWIRTGPLPPVPARLVEALTPKAEVFQSVRREGVIRAGARDHDLFRYAASLRAKRLDEEDALLLMAKRWEDCEQPPGDEYPLETALAKVRHVFKTYQPGRSIDTMVDEPEQVLIAREPLALQEVHQVFTKWLSPAYDLDVLDAVLAVAAFQQLDGDPCWLLVVGGSGAAKTETIQTLAGADAVVTSTIASEGALLSGTSKREHTRDSHGGLLRKIGQNGVLVIKDVTSILSMPRDSRGTVMAALREIYDGKWERNLGTDGGKTLTWIGRLVVIGGVTTAWDSHHSVTATMGDRFVLVRFKDDDDVEQESEQAVYNLGLEDEMRSELAEAVGRLLANVRPVDVDAEGGDLLALANVVTLSRTAVERDHQGNPAWSHARERPTRFRKQLKAIVRGAAAIGHPDPMALATRCAADSIPPLRLTVLLYLLANPHSTSTDLARGTGLVRVTADRTANELMLLGLVWRDEELLPAGVSSRWYWSVHPAWTEHVQVLRKTRS